MAFLAAYEGGFLYTIRSDGTEWTRVAGPVVIAVPDLSVKSAKYYWKTPVLPAWSPDGELLAFVMADEEGEPVGVYTVRPDGADLILVLAAQDPEWARLPSVVVVDGVGAADRS